MGTWLATLVWAGAVAPPMHPPMPQCPSTKWRVSGAPLMPPTREGCLHLAQALHPRVISGTPLSGSVGPREDGMAYEDRDGEWEWSRCQPGHNRPAPTPGTATCPQAFRHQICPINTSMCPPRAKRQGVGLGWTPLGQQGTQGGSSHTRVLLSITYSSRKISTNFPNLLELSFLTVLALPKDSSKGVASRICRGDGKSWGDQPGHPTHHGTSPRLGHPLCHCATLPATPCSMQTHLGAQI